MGLKKRVEKMSDKFKEDVRVAARVEEGSMWDYGRRGINRLKYPDKEKSKKKKRNKKK